MTASRIRWTPEERAKIVDSALKVLLANPAMSIIESVRRVQNETLPSQRRRNLATIGMLPIEVRTALEQRRAAAMGKVEFVPIEEHRQAVLAAVELGRKVEELEALVSSQRSHIMALETIPKPPTEIEVLKGFFVDIASEVIARGRGVPGGPHPTTLVVPPFEEHRISPGPSARHDPEPRGESKERQPVVLVCGIKPKDRPYFESHFNGRLRIKWWFDESYDLLKSKARGSEIAFLVMGDLSHEASIHAQREAPAVQRMATRSRESQRDMIETWLVRRIGEKS